MNKTEEELIWENYIILESFKDYIRKNEDSQLAKDTVELFKKERSRLKPPENDIGFWMKKHPTELWQYLHNIPASKREIAKKQKLFNVNDINNDPNVDLIYNDENWVVIGIKNFEGASKWGGQTTDWCVTKDETHYQGYTEEGIFVFVFDLNKEPYNIHTNDGDPESKYALRITEDLRILDAHRADDVEDSFHFQSEEKPFMEDVNEWVSNNYDEVAGENYQKKIDEADEAAQEFNKKASNGEGMISVDGEGPNEWYVVGFYKVELGFDLKDSKEIDKIIRDVYDGFAYDHEVMEDEIRFMINSENPGYGDNPVLGSVEDIISVIEDLDKDYYKLYYELLDILKSENLIDNMDDFKQSIDHQLIYRGGYDDVYKNYFIIKSYDHHNLSKYSKINLHTLQERIDGFVIDHWEILYNQEKRQMKLDLKYESEDSYAKDFTTNYLKGLIKFDNYKYQQTAFGVDIYKMEAIENRARQIPGGTSSKTKEKFDMQVITKFLINKPKLERELDQLKDEILSESTIIRFKDVFYSQSKIIKESLDPDMIDEIGFYFQDGASVEEIANEFDLETSEIRQAIKIYQSQINKQISSQNSYLKQQNINPKDRRFSSKNMNLDPTKLTSSVDKPDSEYIMKDPSVRDVKPLKRRSWNKLKGKNI